MCTPKEAPKDVLQEVYSKKCTPRDSKRKHYTVVKWVSIIWLFGKKNNASKKIWEFVVPEIFRILVNEPTKLAQKMPFCVSQTLLSSF